MEVIKEKYKIVLAEEDKKAILRVMELSDILYDENICSNKECEKCPLYNGFCISSKIISNDEKIKVFTDILEKFINEE